MKRFYLGTGARFSKKERLRMRREQGSPESVAALESYLLDIYGGEQAVALMNGRSAITAALKYGLGGSTKSSDKDEVIINGFTCHAVVMGVRAAGMTPVYADIDKANLNFNVDTLERVVTPQTRAVIVQNTLGNVTDIAKIEKFCKIHNLALIEDLAHCAGRVYPDGREVGTVGDAVALSFGKEKSVDAVSGGAVVFRKSTQMPRPTEAPDKLTVRRARWYPMFGAWCRALTGVRLNGLLMRILLKTGLVIRSAEGEVNLKRQLSNFQAEVALSQLKTRQKRAGKPLREFRLVHNREEVLSCLRRAGFYFDGFWYEKPVSPERYYKSARFPEDDCPVAVEVAAKIINLPTYYTRKELAPAVKIIEEFVDE